MGHAPIRCDEGAPAPHEAHRLHRWQPMNGRPPALVFALLLASGCGGGDPLPSVPFEPSPDETARVARVVDGETLELQGGRRVRLLGVDAPQGAERCAVEARAFLQGLTVGREVALDVCADPPAGQSPRSGGVTAYVIVDGDVVNEEVIRAGFGRILGVGDCGGESAELRLEAAQAAAQSGQRGVFGDGACQAPGTGPTPPPNPTPNPTPTPPPPTPTPTPPGLGRGETFAGLPVPAGARRIETDADGDTVGARYDIDAPLAAVRAFYDRELPAAGWRIDERDAGGNEVEYDVSRGDDEGKVKLRRRSGGTRIELEVKRDD
jgi:endonuclease YncB( thermonuclease family)